MILKNIIYHIIFLILFLKNINCIDIINSEKQCLIDIAIKTNSTINVPNVDTLICNGLIPYCTCDQNGYLTNLFIESKTTNILTWSDFSCFTKLYYIYMNDIVVDENLLYGPFPPPLQYLVVRTKSIKTIDQVIPNIGTLDIWFTESVPFDLKASYIKNIGSFRFNGVDIINLEIDVNSTEMKLTELSIQTNNVPDVRNLSNLRSITISSYNGLNYSSYSNFIYYNKINSIFFGGVIAYDFPYELGDIVNPSLTFFYFSTGKFNSAKKLIDFSNNKNSQVSIEINGGNNFNYNGLFPFIGFPYHNKKISFSNGNFSLLPDINLFKNTISLTITQCGMNGILPSIPTDSILTSINLKSNKLTGSIDQSWCSKDIDLSNNNLSGKLPDCIYCFLNYSTIASKFSSNSFSNYFTNNKDCTYDNISVYKFILGKNGLVTLVGKNLGVVLDNVKTIPNIKFTTNNYNDSFSGTFEPLVNTTTLKEIKVQLLIPDLNFTVSINTPPLIDTIIQNNNSILINGEYFSYDLNSIQVLIGNNNLNCLIKSSTFNQIQCELNYPILENGNKLLFLCVDGLHTSKEMNLNGTLCLNVDCGINGICNGSNGSCECSNDYITIGNQLCTIPKHYLLETTKVSTDDGGIIELKGWYGNIHQDLQVLMDDNSLSIISISTNIIQVSIAPNIGGPKNLNITQNGYSWNGIIYPYFDKIHGNCNDDGSCICDSNWITVGNQNCSIPNHYVSSSTKVPSESGGNITLGGWFGNFHSNIQVSIYDSGIDLPIYSINNETISTLIGPGSGELIITVKQNGIVWIGSIYPYIDDSINCLNDCNSLSNNGICNKTTGECICNGYLGLDCSIKQPSPTDNNNGTKTETNPDGSTLITNQGIGYLIYIDSISEIDFNNNQIENSIVNLRTGWILDNSTTTASGSNQNIATFVQKINDKVLITMTIEQIKNVEFKQFSFAGNQFTINKGGFKLSLSVSNWNYKSNLNTLQIEMSSDIIIEETDNSNDCDDSSNSDTGIDTVEISSNSNQLLKDNLNYLKVVRDGVVLYGRFQNKMISDGKSTTTITKLKSKDDKSIKIILNLCHCDSCLIDPDFSVILDTDINISKSNSCSQARKKWLLPVVIVLPVTGVAFVISGLILRKKIISQKKLNIKLQNFRNKSN